MITLTAEVDFYADEIFREMGNDEKEEMLELLLEWDENRNKKSQQQPKGIHYEEFRESLDKLDSFYLRLTNEETDLIMDIAKKY